MGRRQRWAGIVSVRPPAARELQAHPRPHRSAPVPAVHGWSASPFQETRFFSACASRRKFTVLQDSGGCCENRAASLGGSPRTGDPRPCTQGSPARPAGRSALGTLRPRGSETRRTPSSRCRMTRVPRGRHPGPTHSPLRSLPGKGSPHPPQSRRPGESSETCPRRPQLTWAGAPEAEHREPGRCALRGLFNLRGSA